MNRPFGEILREKRRAAGISQRQLAGLADVDFSYVSKMENGRLPAPAAETILRFAQVLGCSTEELLAAGRKMPAEIENRLSSEPAALRFLKEASDLRLSAEEWEHMRGTLKGLRSEASRRRRK